MASPNMIPVIRDDINCWHQKFMTKRGRPKTTGIGTPVGARWQDDHLAEIDAWRRAQADLPTRPEAIRRLVRLGLDAAKRGKK